VHAKADAAAMLCPEVRQLFKKRRSYQRVALECAQCQVWRVREFAQISSFLILGTGEFLKCGQRCPASAEDFAEKAENGPRLCLAERTNGEIVKKRTLS
jgi:hypothetical protein